MLKKFMQYKDYTLIQVGEKNTNVSDCLVVTERDDLLTVYEMLKGTYENVILIDDAVRVVLDDCTWSFAVYTKKNLVCKVLEILDGKKYGEIRPWARGYWLPEGFLIDIKTGNFILGDLFFFDYLKAEIENGWGNLKKHLIHQLDEEISIKSEMIKNAHMTEFWIERLKSDIKLATYRKENLHKSSPCTYFAKTL